MELTQEVSTAIEKPILEVIEKRRSLRSYAPEPLSAEQIETLFEAARWAPSAVNEQPWTYLFATRDQTDLWGKIFDSLSEGNKVWAADAPLLVVSMARNSFSRNGLPNPTASYDLGGANAFLSLQATAMGLNLHQMGGYDHGTLRRNLNIPDNFELGVVMAVGFPGSPENLPDNLRIREQAPRSRKLRSAFVMNKTF
jgi:nitroreductase